MAKVRARKLDMSNVKESSGINPKHIESGDYPARVTDVSEVEAKDGTDMWLFVITPDDHRSATYPYYCKLQENQLWKIRNLFIACGINVPKKVGTLDPNRVVNKSLGITLEDDEYEGKMKSVVEAVFPASDLEGHEDTSPADDDDDDDEDEEEAPKSRKKKAPEPEPEDEDEDDEEEEPAPKKKSRKKKAPEPVEEEDDEEEDEEPEEKPVSARTKKRRAAKKAQEEAEEDDDEEEEEPAPKKKKKSKKKAAPVEDDDDELDLDDL